MNQYAPAILTILSLVNPVICGALFVQIAGRKPGLMHDVSTRFMGLIVLAMGVQFALTGLETFFLAAEVST